MAFHNPPGSKPLTCPICRHHARITEHGNPSVECRICGPFVVSKEARDGFFHLAQDDALNVRQRACLSYYIRNRINVPTYDNTGRVLLTDGYIQCLSDTPLILPPPRERADNAIRIIGDHERDIGLILERLEEGFYAQIGAPSELSATDLIGELAQAGLLRGEEFQVSTDSDEWQNLSLTLAGWDRWEALQRGHSESRSGFIAMKFGDTTLDKLYAETIRPAIRTIGDGYDIVRIDDPEVVQAGVIDNIMRERIAGSAFVIADLTHANNGAYWEAGYAEGLGKPVIYICEDAKFSKERTHFDTEHCQTVRWDLDKLEEFSASLVATVRNSLRVRGG